MAADITSLASSHSTLLPAPSSSNLILPTDGFGGSLYDHPFPLPLYATPTPNEFNYTIYASPLIFPSASFHAIDLFAYANSLNSAVYALTLGFLTLTLLNTIVLTPPHKRRLPIFYCLSFGLLVQTARCIFALWLMTAGPSASSYLVLTRDWPDTTLSRRFQTVGSLDQVCGVLAGASVQACLFIQARSLLAVLRVRYHRAVYLALLLLLTLFGVTAVALRTVFAVWQIRYCAFAASPVDAYLSVLDPRFQALHLATAVAYAVSIGSWSLVFVASAGNTLLKRRKLMARQQGLTWYDAALSFIALVGIESFLIPVLLCVLQFLPSDIITVNLEACIVPVVLCLLPMGSLFLNNNNSGNAVTERPVPHHNNYHEGCVRYAKNTSVGRVGTRGVIDSCHSFTVDAVSLRMVSASPQPTSSCLLVERELRDIDAM